MARRSARAVAVAGLVGVLALLAATTPGARAQADGAGEHLGVREVDARDPADVRVTFLYDGDRADVDALTLRQGEAPVEPRGPVTPLGDDRALGLVLLIDTSGSMATDGAIERARQAALEVVAGKAATDELAVVTFDNTVTVLQGLTPDADLLEAAIAKLAPDNGTALYDGVVRSTTLFDDRSLQPNILLLTDGADTNSSGRLERAVGALTRTGTALFAVAIDGPDLAAGPVERLAAESGGRAVVTDDPTELPALFGDVQEALWNQYVVSFTALDDGAAQVTVGVGAAEATAGITRGARIDNPEALVPSPVAEPRGPAFFRTGAGLALALLLVLAAVGTAVWSIASTFARSEGRLQDTLRPYEEGYVAADADDPGDTSIAQTALLQRAVGVTERFADRQGFLQKVESKLEQADLPLRPAEAMFFYAVAAALVLLLVAVVSGTLVVLLAVGVLAVLLPPGVLNLLAARRRKAFQSVLPDTLQLLASTLRAGYSLMQGVEAVSVEVSEPMGRELRRVVTEARLGRPLEESMEAVADRMTSPDFAWAVMAIRIQREVGGNLAELLVTVADTMTERERLRRDVSALTAEGRVSAIVLGILPVGVGFFIASANPGYLDPLFERTAGQIMLGGALVLMLAGFLWMKKIIEVEI